MRAAIEAQRKADAAAGVASPTFDLEANYSPCPAGQYNGDRNVCEPGTKPEPPPERKNRTGPLY